MMNIQQSTTNNSDTNSDRNMEPVILHQSFERSETKRLLAKFYKVRVVSNIEPNSIIFPKKSRAFLVKPICELTHMWPPVGNNFIDQQEIQSFGVNSNVIFYPATSIPQCIGMINGIIQPKTNYEAVMNEVETLREGKLDEEMVTEMLQKNIGITSHDAMVMQDGCKTISKISQASTDDLLDCSLSIEVANKVQSFFK